MREPISAQRQRAHQLARRGGGTGGRRSRNKRVGKGTGRERVRWRAHRSAQYSGSRWWARRKRPLPTLRTGCM